MRNISKLLAPALIAGVMGASTPVLAAPAHIAKAAKTEKVKPAKVEKKHASKSAKTR